MKQFLSPKQVAEAIGVSESSLKRWCDQGIVPVERTPGGHRKIQLASVMHLLRHGNHKLLHPELLGLPIDLAAGIIGEGHVDELVRSLIVGDSDNVREILFTRYLAGASVSEIGDEVIGTAMHRIGDRWECGELEIFQERRACEILAGILHELRIAMGNPAGPLALGGTASGDPYRLATALVELTLVEAGWRATSLGTSLPFCTLTRAVEQHQPDLIWLSVSHVATGEDFADTFAEWATSLDGPTQVVYGGQQADPAWTHCREKIHYCASLSELRRFAHHMMGTAAAD